VWTSVTCSPSERTGASRCAKVLAVAVAVGQGPLTSRVVLHHARGMLSARFGRIASAAFVLFVPPAALYFGAELVREAHADSDGSLRLGLLAAVIAVASLAGFLGEIFFAGFLDIAIGDDYFRDERHTLGRVLESLPWRPLLVVDVVVNVAAAVGLALFFVPGIAVYTLFGLVGPVVVQERRGIADALRRTARISRPHWPLVLALVVIPLGVEHALAELVRHLVRDDGLIVTVAAEWLIAATLLAVVGVVEVALATELMVRTRERLPGPSTTNAPG
jgi:hypothetical protein